VNVEKAMSRSRHRRKSFQETKSGGEREVTVVCFVWRISQEEGIDMTGNWKFGEEFAMGLRPLRVWHGRRRGWQHRGGAEAPKGGWEDFWSMSDQNPPLGRMRGQGECQGDN